MANQRILRTETDAPGFEILSNGALLNDNFKVKALQVSKSVNSIPTARLTLEDNRDFSASNSNEFLPGAEIEIKMGYHNNYETVFKGIIISHGVKMRQDKGAKLIVELKDAAVKMTVGRKNKYFNDLTDSAIIEEIIRSYGFEAELEHSPVNQAEIVQYYCTDWDFIVSRAEANGMLVFVDDGTITVKPPDLDQGAVFKLDYGVNIYEFDTETDATDQFNAVESSAWKPSSQEVISTKAMNPGIPEQGNIKNSDLAKVIGLDNLSLQHSGNLNSEELQSWANARLLRSKLAKIKGRIRTIGLAGIKPGNIVELAGMSDRFNGMAFVSAVSHHFGTGGSWFTDIEIGLSQQWLISHSDKIMAKPSSSLLPGINGLQIGIVTVIHNDPDNADRICVRLPLVSTSEQGIWARIATLDAGNHRGSFFRPEVGDEVIVGFINDDPRDAIVLGMLNSSAKPAPITATVKNNEKGFVTKNQIKLLFDDEKNSITIETPNRNKAVLSDSEKSVHLEDEHGNKMTLGTDGILIDSSTDITIRASGKLNLESGSSMSLSAASAFKAEGTGGAELSSSATVVVKGSLVSIN